MSRSSTCQQKEKKKKEKQSQENTGKNCSKKNNDSSPELPRDETRATLLVIIILIRSTIFNTWYIACSFHILVFTKTSSLVLIQTACLYGNFALQIHRSVHRSSVVFCTGTTRFLYGLTRIRLKRMFGKCFRGGTVQKNRVARTKRN